LKSSLRSLIASLFTLLFLATAAGVAGQPAEDPSLRLEGAGPWVVRVDTVDPETVGTLAFPLRSRGPANRSCNKCRR